jgi:hypothetical protein
VTVLPVFVTEVTAMDTESRRHTLTMIIDEQERFSAEARQGS